MTNKTYYVDVEPPSHHDLDNFTMHVPTLEVTVHPDENRPWRMEARDQANNLSSAESKPQAVISVAELQRHPQFFDEVEINFRGFPTHITGYQAAVIRFHLDGHYKWFGNGITVVSISENTNMIQPVMHFRHFISRDSERLIVLTIEIENQVAFTSELAFRFKVIDDNGDPDDSDVSNAGITTVLVSEDPVVRPTKPVNG